jgi:hypothetical protein
VARGNAVARSPPASPAQVIVRRNTPSMAIRRSRGRAKFPGPRFTTRNSGMLQWKIGDVTVTQLIEMTDGSGSLPLLPDATPENLAQIPWLKPNYVTPEGNLILNIQMLIIETPEQKMVVDTCIGNDKTLNMEGWANLQLPFLDDLKKMGHDPASIDKVICTHLHVDHVGWNTRKVENKWVPTFPNARYVMVEDGFTFWRDLEEDSFGDVFGESVAPVVDAGQADFVQPDHKVSDHVWF